MLLEEAVETICSPLKSRAMGVAAMLRTNASSDCLHSCSAGVIRFFVPLPPPPPPLDGLGTWVTGLELIVW